MANRGHFLRVNEHLGPLDWLASPNGQFFTMMQRDGNLVVYEGTAETGGKGLWGYSDFSREDDDYFAVLQRDGNLCVYRGTGPNDNRGNIWCTRPVALEESDDYKLIMQNDGNLCVYRGDPGPQTYVWGWMELKGGRKEWWEEVGDFLGDIPDHIDDAWHATSDSVSSVAEGARRAGVEVGEAFIAGAEATQAALETGAEATRQGLVEMGRYINQHACSIAVGSTLTATVTVFMTHSSPATAIAELIAASAGRSVNEAARNAAARSIGHMLAEPVSQIPIPGFSSSREEIGSVIAFLILSSTSGKKAGERGPGFLGGAIIYGLTEFICSGNLPGGYNHWKGAQAEIPQG
jgi:hypothetical protein